MKKKDNYDDEETPFRIKHDLPRKWLLPSGEYAYLIKTHAIEWNDGTRSEIEIDGRHISYEDKDGYFRQGSIDSVEDRIIWKNDDEVWEQKMEESKNIYDDQSSNLRNKLQNLENHAVDLSEYGTPETEEVVDSERPMSLKYSASTHDVMIPLEQEMTSRSRSMKTCYGRQDKRTKIDNVKVGSRVKYRYGFADTWIIGTVTKVVNDGENSYIEVDKKRLDPNTDFHLEFSNWEFFTNYFFGNQAQQEALKEIGFEDETETPCFKASCRPCRRCVRCCCFPICSLFSDCCLGFAQYFTGQMKIKHVARFKKIRSLKEFMVDARDFQTGDVLLVHNDAAWYTSILTRSRWTHVAVVYRKDYQICSDEDKILGEHAPSDVMVFEITNGHKYRRYGCDLKDIEQWAKTFLYRKGFYIGYRKLKYRKRDGMTVNQQKLHFQEKFRALRDKPYGGMLWCDDFSAVWAICRAHECCPCVKTDCLIGNRDQLFCSELVAELYEEFRADDNEIDGIEGVSSDTYFPSQFGDETGDFYLENNCSLEPAIYYWDKVRTKEMEKKRMKEWRENDPFWYPSLKEQAMGYQPKDYTRAPNNELEPIDKSKASECCSKSYYELGVCSRVCLYTCCILPIPPELDEPWEEIEVQKPYYVEEEADAVEFEPLAAGSPQVGNKKSEEPYSTLPEIDRLTLRASGVKEELLSMKWHVDSKTYCELVPIEDASEDENIKVYTVKYYNVKNNEYKKDYDDRIEIFGEGVILHKSPRKQKRTAGQRRKLQEPILGKQTEYEMYFFSKEEENWIRFFACFDPKTPNYVKPSGDTGDFGASDQYFIVKAVKDQNGVFDESFRKFMREVCFINIKDLKKIWECIRSEALHLKQLNKNVLENITERRKRGEELLEDVKYKRLSSVKSTSMRNLFQDLCLYSSDEESEIVNPLLLNQMTMRSKYNSQRGRKTPKNFTPPPKINLENNKQTKQNIVLLDESDDEYDGYSDSEQDVYLKHSGNGIQRSNFNSNSVKL